MDSFIFGTHRLLDHFRMGRPASDLAAVLVERISIPEPVKQEGWLSESLHYFIVDQIARIQNAVRAERDPALRALTDAPTVTFRAEGLDFDFDKNIIQPIRLALGRQPITVKTTISCFFPRCLRSEGESCSQPIAAPSATDAGPANVKGRLCLRVSAEISDGSTRRYFSTRLNLENDNFKKELLTEFGRVAEEVIFLARSRHHALSRAQEDRVRRHRRCRRPN